jgi:hypothetical protein
MHTKLLVVLRLCAVSILKTANAAPLCHLDSTNDFDYHGYSTEYVHPKKHHLNRYPSNYRRRLQDARANTTESADYEHESYGGSYSCDIKGYSGGDCDDFDCEGYGDSYDYKSNGSDCDDGGDGKYGNDNDNSSFDKGNGYDYYLRLAGPALRLWTRLRILLELLFDIQRKLRLLPQQPLLPRPRLRLPWLRFSRSLWLRVYS